ncbi:hypothetical protein J4461_00525 [Candidatus Pacearchaeota archaeon]|nr:hypothetical protein [Candidatus Pacearchaeota archaeon]
MNISSDNLGALSITYPLCSSCYFSSDKERQGIKRIVRKIKESDKTQNRMICIRCLRRTSAICTCHLTLDLTNKSSKILSCLETFEYLSKTSYASKVSGK